MLSRSFLSSVLIPIICTLLAAPPLHAQPDSTLFVVANCMKSKTPDFVKLEREVWQPMHQEMVDQGQLAGWALYEVRFGSRDECDYYTVDRYRGVEALNNAFSNLRAIFEKVHPDADFGETMAASRSSRDNVSSFLLATVDGVPPANFNYAHVNWMNAPNGGAYVHHERTLFKPVHQALVEDGVTKGWMLQELVKPVGSSLGYNFVTVDFVDSLPGIPFGEYVRKVHPDLTMDEIWEQTDASRDLVRSETWRLIATTTGAMMSDE